MELPDGFHEVASESLWNAFLMPELVKRGLSRLDVVQALVVIEPDSEPAVYLNQEARLSARVTRADGSQPEAGTSGPLQVGDMIEGLHPLEFPPNAQWVAYVALGEGRGQFTFDLRSNRTRAAEHVVLALEYLNAAEAALRIPSVAPAIECGFASAELTVNALMMLTREEPRTKSSAHARRARFIAADRKLGNVSEEAGRVLGRLAPLRPAARYCENVPELPDATTLGEWLEHLRALTEEAMARIGMRETSEDKPPGIPG